MEMLSQLRTIPKYACRRIDSWSTLLLQPQQGICRKQSSSQCRHQQHLKLCFGFPAMQQLLRVRQGVTATATRGHARRHCTPQPAAAMATQAAVHPLWQRTLQVYEQAQQTGAATKTDTQVHLFDDGSIDFVLRIASALKAKPKGLAGSRYGCVAMHALLPADVGLPL